MYRSLPRIAFAITAIVALSSCAEETTVVMDLEDHADPLTSEPSDNLFTLEIFELERVYTIEELAISVNPYGGSTAPVAFELAVDQNGDGALGVGDELVGREGESDAYNESHSGTLFEVSIQVVDESGTARELLLKQWVGDGGLG